MSPSPAPAHLASLLSDEPRWIDLKGLLISGRCDLWSESEPEDGFVARSWDYPFAALHAMPGASLIRQAVEAGRSASQGQYPTDEWQLLAPPSSRGTVEAALPGWRRSSVHLHRWAGDLEQPEFDVEASINLLPDGHGAVGLPFDHVPATARHEYTLDWVAKLGFERDAEIDAWYEGLAKRP